MGVIESIARCQAAQVPDSAVRSGYLDVNGKAG
jgi:hypothetical protein